MAHQGATIACSGVRQARWSMKLTISLWMAASYGTFSQLIHCFKVLL